MKKPAYYLNLCAEVDGVEEVIWTGLTGDLARLAVEIAAEATEKGAEVVDAPSDFHGAGLPGA